MSSVLDEYIKKEVEEDRKTQATAIATTMLKEGIAVDIIAKALPSLSLEFIKQLQQQLSQA